MVAFATDCVWFHCPHCGKKLYATEKLFGRTALCSKCYKQVAVPQATAPPLAPSVPINDEPTCDDDQILNWLAGRQSARG